MILKTRKKNWIQPQKYKSEKILIHIFRKMLKIAWKFWKEVRVAILTFLIFKSPINI